jgi:hypothetical protein
MTHPFQPDIILIKEVLRGKYRLGDELVDELIEGRLSLSAFIYSGEFDLDTMILRAMIKYFGVVVEIIESDEALMSPTGRLPFLTFSDGTCICDMSSMLRVLQLYSQRKLDMHEQEAFDVIAKVLRPAVIKAISTSSILWKYVERYPWYLACALYFNMYFESRKIAALQDVSMCLASLKSYSSFTCMIIACYEHVINMLPTSHPLRHIIVFSCE